jgi:ribulose-5-phosphate 4-epimerase/fuculose-1-phosphate aldolase
MGGGAVSDRGAASDRDERDDAFALAGAGIVRVARHLSARGLSPGSSGNLSVRVGDRVLLTPTGSSLARVAADELAEVGLDGDPIGGERPTKELAIHLGVYAADPTARAVVHLHAPASTAISCLPPRADGLADLPTYTPYRVMSLGDVPLVPYAAPGDRALGDAVAAEIARGRRVLLLANHGSVLAAVGLDRAADLAEELEASAQLALTLAGRGAVELTDSQRAALLTGAVDPGWEQVSGWV